MSDDDVLIRTERLTDIGGVVALQRSCFPPPFSNDLLWKPEHVGAHITQFPEGQFVAVIEDQIVASATNLLMTEVNWQAHLSWENATGCLALPHHDSTGKTLYGIDISVHPQLRGKGIARKLYRARYHLVLNGPLRSYGTVCRLPDYRRSNCPTPKP